MFDNKLFMSCILCYFLLASLIRETICFAPTSPTLGGKERFSGVVQEQDLRSLLLVPVPSSNCKAVIAPSSLITTSARFASTSTSTSLSRPRWSKTETKQESSVGWKWILAAFAAGLARPYIGTWLAMAQTNYYWQTNLVKNSCSVAAVLFVWRTQKKPETVGWPQHILATGVVGLAVNWITNQLPLPFYGVNLCKHIFWMWAVIRSINFYKDLQQRRRLEAFRMEATTAAASLSSTTSVAPTTTQTAPIGDAELSEGPLETATEADAVELVQSEMQRLQSTAASTLESSLSFGKKPSGQNSVVVTQTFRDWLYSLANLQEYLAEIQLEKIPAFFSTEVYDTTQVRLTKFQAETIPNFFEKRKKEEKEDSK